MYRINNKPPKRSLYMRNYMKIYRNRKKKEKNKREQILRKQKQKIYMCKYMKYYRLFKNVIFKFENNFFIT